MNDKTMREEIKTYKVLVRTVMEWARARKLYDAAIGL